jgi:SAM-dependent methyltransferase
MDKAWFKTWFNSPYYHILYKERDEKEAQFFLDRLIEFLKPQPDAKILDIACGKGRHALYLNKKGFDVTGFDLSAESIEYDKQFENEALSFHVHDMREVFRVNYFDYVFNLFSSFGYFDNPEDNARTVSSHAQALKPGGVLVLDYMNSEMVCDCLIPDQVKVIEGIRFHIRKRIKDMKIIKQISFEDKGKSYSFEEHLSIFSLEDFEKLFSHCHLQIKNTFGDYALNTFDENTSDRLILVAEKTPD